jgi:hypothetical protein
VAAAPTSSSSTAAWARGSTGSATSTRWPSATRCFVELFPGDRPRRLAGDDEARFREICRHNLLVNMLSDPARVTDEAVDIQAECVRRARFDSRKVSGGHWSAYENAPEVNRLMLEFFAS